AIENELVERHKKGLYQQQKEAEKLIEKVILERIQKGVGDIYNYPVDAYNKVLDMEKLQPADEEDEEEAEIEYVEGYDELEEEDDIEDFGAFSIHESQGNDSDDENDGSSEDEETKALNQRKAKRKSTLASKKLEKDDLDSKSKKTRVLVEVI
ncbi:MAK16-like protein, partial [Trifolium medium]|nr:MAK16-like protein [Trifolium medium]